MKTIHQTKETLIVKQAHWLLALVFCLIGIGIILMPGSAEVQDGDMISGNWAGLIIFVFGSLFFEYSCTEISKADGYVYWSIRRLWRSKRGEIRIADITHIRRSASYGKGGGKTYRIVILCGDDEFPISMIYSTDGNDRQDETVARMREFCGLCDS